MASGQDHSHVRRDLYLPARQPVPRERCRPLLRWLLKRLQDALAVRVLTHCEAGPHSRVRPRGLAHWAPPPRCTQLIPCKLRAEFHNQAAPTVRKLRDPHLRLRDVRSVVAGSRVHLQHKPFRPFPQQLAHSSGTLLVEHDKQAVPTKEQPPVILLRIPQRLLQPFHIPCHCIHLPLHPLHNSFQPLNTGLGIPGSRGCEPILLPHFIHPARQLTLKGMRRGGLRLSLHSCPIHPRLGSLLSGGNVSLSCVQRHWSGWSVALLLACKGRTLLLRIARHRTQHWRCKKLKQANTIK